MGRRVGPGTGGRREAMEVEQGGGKEEAVGGWGTGAPGQRDVGQAAGSWSSLPPTPARLSDWSWRSTLVWDALMQTVREVKESKLIFCLGSLSVFLVVICAALLTSLLDNAPIIFLREAETLWGQGDVRFTPRFAQGTNAINYTVFRSALDAAGPALRADPRAYADDGAEEDAGRAAAVLDFSYHAPRKVFSMSIVPVSKCVLPLGGVGSSRFSDGAWLYEAPSAAELNVTQNGASDPAIVARAPFASSCPWGACFASRCDTDGVEAVPVLASDLAAEERAGIGRQWAGGVVPADGVALPRAMASDLGVVKGDYVAVLFYPGTWLRDGLRPEEPANARAVLSEVTYQGPGSPLDADASDPRPVDSPLDVTGWSDAARWHPAVSLTLRVSAVVPGGGGKVPRDNDDVTAYVDLGRFASYATTRLHPDIRWRADEPVVNASTPATDRPLPARSAEPARASALAAEAVDAVWLNLPPQVRVEAYTRASGLGSAVAVSEFGAQSLFVSGGFSQVSTSQPIRGDLRAAQFIVLYLGLLIDVLLFVLFSLSAILLYALLTINVRAREFELAIRRALGANQPVLVLLLVVQSLSYALPAWVLGLVVSAASIGAVMAEFSAVSGIPVQGELSASGVGIATALAFLVPLLGGAGPIWSALKGESLRDSLDPDRAGKNNDIIHVKIESAVSTGLVSSSSEAWAALALQSPSAEASSTPPQRRSRLSRLRASASARCHSYCSPVACWSCCSSTCAAIPLNLLILGLCAAVFGFAIYFLLPLSLLSLNLSLFFNLFFYVFVGMLLGLVLLFAVNAEGLLEQLVAFLLLFWEHRSVLRIAMGQLQAHRSRNRTTAVMFALAISFVVFVFVAANQEVQSTEFEAKQEAGGPLRVVAPPAFSPSGRSLADLEALGQPQTGPLASSADALPDLDWELSWTYVPLTDYSSGVDGYGAAAARWQQGWPSDQVWSSQVAALTGNMSRLAAVRADPSSSASAVAAWELSTAAAADSYTAELDEDKFASRGGTPLRTSTLGNLGRIAASDVSVVPVSPNFAAVADRTFWVLDRERSLPPGPNPKLTVASSAARRAGSQSAAATASQYDPPRSARSVTAQLYSIQGSQGALASAAFQLDASLFPGDDALLSTQESGAAGTTFSRIAIQSTAQSAPVFSFSRTGSGDPESLLVSLPLATALLAERGRPTPLASLPLGPATLAPASLGQTRPRAPPTLVLQDAAPATYPEDADWDTAEAAAVGALNAASSHHGAFTPGPNLYYLLDVRTSLGDVDTTLAVLNFLFAFLTFVAMFLCFFSLLSAMITNVHTQRRESGVLLSLGLSPVLLRRVFVQEAFLLVLSSSLSGLLIGTVVAWVFSQQRILFTDLPLQFVVPWPILGAVLVGAVVAAILASYVPASALIRTPITHLLKGSLTAGAEAETAPKQHVGGTGSRDS